MSRPSEKELSTLPEEEDIGISLPLGAERLVCIDELLAPFVPF